MTVQEQRRGATTEPLLRVEALTVRFAAFNALTDVDLEIRFGETVALAGENGAGKSTLIRCIGGDIAPTSGRVCLGGERVSSSPAAAARRGVAVVWQDLALCDNLDVAANLLLGNEQPRCFARRPQLSLCRARALRELGIPLAGHDTPRRLALRAASASCSPSRVRCPVIRGCSCSTSRRRRWACRSPPRSSA